MKKSHRYAILAMAALGLLALVEPALADRLGDAIQATPAEKMQGEAG